jgi:hypothetical protein
MRPSFISATLATLAAVACVVVSPIGVANADQSAQSTINELYRDGYTVNVDRVGSGPIDQCVVTSVRNPQTQTRTIRDYYGPRDANGNRRSRIIEIVTGRTISVSLNCSP